MYKRYRFSSGFTIVELLVVIAVIGILVGIVTLGYSAYTKNAQQSKVTTVVRTYQDALNGVIFEKDLSPSQEAVGGLNFACLFSNTSACCYAGIPPPQQMVCGNNTELNGLGYNTLATYNTIKKYLPSNPPKLPKISSAGFEACGAIVARDSPCDTQDVGYIPIVQGGTGTSKGVLSYYLPVNFDCGVPDVLTYTYAPTGDFLKPTTDKYTRRVTATSPQFTECLVAIK